MQLPEINEQLLHDLKQVFKAHQIKSDDIYRQVYSRDASYFNLPPQLVVRPESADEVVTLVKLLNKHKQHVTFRTGGTSLSGQAVGNGVICDLRTAWKNIEVREKGEKVWFEPGLTCQQVNKLLAHYGKRLGPDPASHRAAMMGGILANNSSGMQAGTKYNSYHMLTSIEFIMVNGNQYDTSKPEDRKRFEENERELCNGLIEIRQEIMTNPNIRERIISKYKIKNVTGYGMNAFIDYEHPFDIFAHLLIGSEGTLAFIVSAEQKTLPLYSFYSSSMLYFKDTVSAAAAVPMIAESPALSVEMMDFGSLQSVVGTPIGIPELSTIPTNSTALLIDYGSNSQEELRDLTDKYLGQFKGTSGLFQMDPFTTTVEQRERFWKIRDGIFPCVAGVRNLGDTVILEDVVSPVDNLYKLVDGIQNLYKKYDYKGAIFGHARDGDLHPLITSGMQDKTHVKHFGDFMEEFISLVLSLDGSLKGEHGTGRAVAPFVEREWGPEIYAMMKKLKSLADPQNLLNPDVMICDDPNAHLENVKAMTPIGSEYHDHKVDMCIECGFCEHVCPSRYFTLTPRQRIQSLRIIQSMDGGEDKTSLEKEYKFEGMDTCAADGMCQTVCPMGINTGDLTDKLREISITPKMSEQLYHAANNSEKTEKHLKEALNFAVDVEHIFTSKPIEWALAVAHGISDATPHWSKNFPKAPKFKPQQVDNPAFIYFPACVTRIFGGTNEKKDDMMTVILRIAKKAGVAVELPEDTQGLCCSQIWQHKGEMQGAKVMANKVIDHFWLWSKEGNIPIVCDTTSCTHTLINKLCDSNDTDTDNLLSDENIAKYKKIKILDITEWINDILLPKLNVTHKKGKILIHPTCACAQMGLNDKMISIAQHCAETVVLPENWGCCGASGDRGFIFPALGESGTRDERNELKGEIFDGCYSLARTCEINLEDHTSYPFESIAYLVDETTN
ncbi:MAG: FAD-binding and (Fe-S)-binding domain-containing protein [Marinifilaceae bacterium]